jgi:hypothetical protein
VYSNISLINSNVKTINGDRDLQGQSNYILNGGVVYTNNKHSINLTYNRIGDRIYAIGFQGYSDIIEKSRNIIDVTYMKQLKNGELKLSITDLVRNSSIYYQSPNRDLINIKNQTLLSATLNLNL